MKKIVFLSALGAVFMLSACGKTDFEKQVEKDTAISKKMAGDVSKVPRIIMAPDTPANKGKEGGK